MASQRKRRYTSQQDQQSLLHIYYHNFYNDDGTFLRYQFPTEDDELVFSGSASDSKVGNEDLNEQHINKLIDFHGDVVNEIEAGVPMKQKCLSLFFKKTKNFTYRNKEINVDRLEYH